MSMNITFDTANNPAAPILVLATRSGEKLGQLNAENIVCNDSLKEASELSFRVRKYLNGKKTDLWNKLVNFKLVWCKNYDTWFQITVDIDESDETIKNVLGVRLGEAELSQIMLYDIEINTEDDIARDDYKITVLFNQNDKEASLLHRIMEKAPHYSVTHVDSTIKNIQRTFTFNNTSIYDSLQEIGEEIGCLFILNSNSDENGDIQRTISVYDIQSYCYECGHRGNFTLSCPKCHSKNINEGYGEDTTIFVTSDELGEDIQFTTDTGAVKNCFKLEAGDDLMTATIKNCNPNGSGYIWYFSDDMKTDMSDELVERLTDYDKDYAFYQSDYIAHVNSITAYNDLINKYKTFNPDLESISSQIKGYSAIMNSLYNTINFKLYLQSELMPDASLGDTSAAKQADLLTISNLSPIAVENTKNISLATANSAVLLMAKVIVDSRYQVKINTSSFTSLKWTGNFVITNYSDEKDTATSKTITITINDSIETYLKQKIEKSLSKNENYDLSIANLFKMSENDFKVEIRKYCLNRLTAFYDACQSCLDILIEQGIADKESWNASGKTDKNLYDNLYLPYHTKLEALEKEIKQREQEIKQIDDIAAVLGKHQQNIQKILNFEEYLGKDLWLEFCAYRREDTYSNTNYISDGLNDSKIFDKANEFIKVAKEEIFKSAELQHSITSKLKNLLVIEKFQPLVDKFKVGNWIRIQIDDMVYKLRLLFYEVDFDNIENLSVEFSDVMKTTNGLTDQSELMHKASSMASSYDSTKRQAEQGKKSKEQLNDWVDKGLSLTNIKIIGNADNQNQTWDEHGILCREYSPITDSFDDKQLKIINRGLYVTNDNWKTAKAGIGNFTFWNPETQEMDEAYGVIADTLVGNLILSEKVGVYNQNNSIQLSENGIVVTTNGILDDDNVGHNKMLFSVQKETKDGIEKLMYIDDNGNLVLNGSMEINSGTSSNSTFDEVVQGLNTTIGNNTTSINKINDSKTGIYARAEQYIKDYKSEIGQYLTYDTQGLTLGAKVGTYESPYKITLDNKQLNFLYNNKPVAFINSEVLSINNGIFNGTIYSNNCEIEGGLIAGWKITPTKIYYDGTPTAVIQRPTANSTYVFAAGGYNNSDYSDCPFRVTKYGVVYIGTDTSNQLKLEAGHIDFYYDNQRSGRIGQTSENDIAIENTNLSLTKAIYCDGGIYGRTGYSKDGYYEARLIRYVIQDSQHLIGLGDGSRRDGIELYSNHNLRFPNDYGITLNGGSIAFRYYNNAVYCGIDTKPLRLVGSSITSNGSSVTSDIRMKNSVVDIDEKYLELLNLLDAKTYKFNRHNPETTNTGFIAQEVLSALKQLELSPKDFGGFVDIYGDGSEYALDYTQFIAILWKAVQNINQELANIKQGKEGR